MNTQHATEIERFLKVELTGEVAVCGAKQPTSIMCGTDFSEGAADAVEVAVAMARHTGDPLVLVHAVNDDSQKSLPGDLRESLKLYARAQLHDERERIQALGVEMVEAFRVGVPEAVLAEEVAAHRAKLLVLAGSKRHAPGRWIFRSPAEKVAPVAGVPTLLVRDASPLLGWMRGERRLRVFVGADFSKASEAALHVVKWLRDFGPCDVVATYLEPEMAPFSANLHPSPWLDDMMLATVRMQERYFRQRVRTILGTSRVRIRFEQDWSQSDAHLIQLAAEERADLIVVGTQSRQGWHRLGHHSVSRGVLHYAPLNVLCVPAGALDTPRTVFREPQATLNPSTP